MMDAAGRGPWRRPVSRRALLRATAALAVVPSLAAFRPDGIDFADAMRGWRNGTASGLTAWVRERLMIAAAAVAALREVRGARTVENTLEPYDRARNALAMAANQAQLLASAAATAEMRDAARRSLGEVSSAAVSLDLDPAVHRALLALKASRGAGHADDATRRYVEQALLRGRLAGADRDGAIRETVRRLQTRIREVSALYAANMHRPGAPVETTVESLEGLPADFLTSHPPDAKGTVRLTTASIDALPVLRFAADADLRRRMYVASENQGFPSNAAVLAELVSARADLARALGYESYAELTLSDQMIGSPSKAQALLDRVETLSRATAEREAADVRAYAKGVDPSAVVSVADAAYWTERYRRDTFGIDAQEVRAYLPFARVLPGVLDFAARFFHLRFAPVPGDAAWHAQVYVFDVHDAMPAAADRLLGRVYVDAHPREGKDQIFATAPLVPGIGGRQLPEGVILCNLPGGNPQEPGLLAHSDVVNLLHEFGHLMHHVLAGRGRWSGQGAFDTEEDFLEAPSQMLEEFARDASVLQAFARHHQTGAVMPDEMIERLNRSAAFGRAAWLRAQAQRARLALAIHRSAVDEGGMEAEDRSSAARYTSYQLVGGTHAYAASPHLIDYGPNYYMYLLDKVIAVDLANRFPAGDAAAGSQSATYRRRVLEPGAGRPAASLLRDFLGRAESYDALSDWVGGRNGRR